MNYLKQLEKILTAKTTIITKTINKIKKEENTQIKQFEFTRKKTNDENCVFLILNFFFKSTTK
jgi:hypothetical protein